MLIQQNNQFSIVDFTGTHDKLPVGTYRLRQDPKTEEYYLIQTEDFTLPSKLYGNFNHVDRILNTFNSGNKNLGVLFIGTKGSGKSIDAKQLCIKSKMPVILIDKGTDHPNLISFLASPELGSCVVFIDEYEKLFSEPKDIDETVMLQLLDGATNMRHLFILTCNESRSFNSNLINRPSRIYYRKVYGSLADEIINDVIDAELQYPERKEELLKVLNRFSDVTFDILMSMIKEINLYNESPEDVIKIMNFSPESVMVKVAQVLESGELVDATYNSFLELSDPSEEFNVKNYEFEPKRDNDTRDWTYYEIPISDLVRVSRNAWEYKKTTKSGKTLHWIITKSTLSLTL